ncbi:DNA-binding protein C1D involved in regulation of double-strand break repair [Plasmopara halstedii]|uniref:Nuclear nucleic acid-binding protein C1D n=1 Tax=Plasmopara halstedii TaxID=4781 RepID=A0A0P1AY87_PLAHL|nr:DNA-binding protein C1D involved in regulation of double-strand break repair [Plasmopara halstedii]CEG46087.1 DNA-binding protein C1D involved in regulation of double-strand break repair [Plasmopara halstedii]|eukprot:XP_024582456.1 DNA-binding protein C1D involved in regulation of double-strand break repair [Plasmopara halstedii]
MSCDSVEAFNSVERTLEAVEEHLAILKRSNVEDLMVPLNSLERAKMQVLLAYTINALLFIYLKTQGVSAKDIRQSHVKKELERVKAFIKKLKDAEDKAKGPRLVLDKDATQRFIHSALSADQAGSSRNPLLKRVNGNGRIRLFPRVTSTLSSCLSDCTLRHMPRQILCRNLVDIDKFLVLIYAKQPIILQKVNLPQGRGVHAARRKIPATLDQNCSVIKIKEWAPGFSEPR